LWVVPYVYYKERPTGPHAGDVLQPFFPLPEVQTAGEILQSLHPLPQTPIGPKP
jgi:hypothetical protein